MILIYLPVIAFLSLLNLIGVKVEYENRFFVFIAIIVVSCCALVMAAIGSNSLEIKYLIKF